MISGFLLEKLYRLCGSDFRKTKFEVAFIFPPIFLVIILILHIKKAKLGKIIQLDLSHITH